MSVFCARQKKKRKKGTVAVDEFSFLRREKKKVRYAYSPFNYLFSIHKAKKVSAKVGRDTVSKV